MTLCSLFVVANVPAGSRGGVSISAFQMGKYEVTQAQFNAEMGFNPSKAAWTGNDKPVGNVTAYEVLSFCNMLSVAEGLEPVYTLTNVVMDTGAYTSEIAGATVSIDFGKNGYRLPNYDEWVYAALGGATTTYSWGTAIDAATVGQYASYYSNSHDVMPSVGLKLPNGYGLYDMAGSVWEWALVSTGPLTTYRCGGCINGDAASISPTNNNNMDPKLGGHWGYNDDGFRVARK